MQPVMAVLNSKTEFGRGGGGGTNYIHARSLHNRNLSEVVQFSFQLYINACGITQAKEQRRIQDLGREGR